MKKYMGTNIYLRFLNAEDAEELLKLQLRNRPAFEQISIARDEAYYTLVEQTNLIANWAVAKENRQRYTFGIFLASCGQLIGDISLFELVLDSSRKWLLGYALDEVHQGKGYMSEAIRLVLNYAFMEANLEKVEAGAKPDNAGSIRVLEKAGFTAEGILHNHVKINGEWVDHLMFSIGKEKYL